MITTMEATCNICGRILHDTRCKYCGESAVDSLREAYMLQGFTIEGLEVKPVEPEGELEAIASSILGYGL